MAEEADDGEDEAPDHGSEAIFITFGLKSSVSGDTKNQPLSRSTVKKGAARSFQHKRFIKHLGKESIFEL